MNLYKIDRFPEFDPKFDEIKVNASKPKTVRAIRKP